MELAEQDTPIDVTTADPILEKIKKAAAADPTLQKLKNQIICGFPNDKCDLDAELRPY